MECFFSLHIGRLQGARARLFGENGFALQIEKRNHRRGEIHANLQLGGVNGGDVGLGGKIPCRGRGEARYGHETRMAEKCPVLGGGDADDVIGQDFDLKKSVVVGDDDALGQFFRNSCAGRNRGGEAKGEKQDGGEQLFHGKGGALQNENPEEGSQQLLHSPDNAV